MATFDRILWLRRANRRYFKALEDGRPKARDNFDRDKHYIECLGKAIRWAGRRGVKVSFNWTGAMDGKWVPETRTIEVSCRCVPEYQLYTFLHEAGHFLVQDARTFRTPYIKRYGEGYIKGYGPKLINDFGYRLAVLDEELEAWHRGRKLARRLNLVIDDSRFIVRRKRMLKTYVHWAHDPSTFTTD